MKNLRFFSLIFSVIMHSNTQAQTVVSDVPRIVVLGEHTIQADPDSYFAMLYIEDNSGMNYEPSPTHMFKLFKARQQKIIDQLNIKEFMVKPTYDALKSYNGTGPFELKIGSNAQLELIKTKALALSGDETSVYLDAIQPLISDERRANISAQAMDKAIAQAKQKAERMAKSLGMTVGGPMVVEEYPDYVGYEYEPYGYMQGSNTTVPISSKVHIQFELKR